MNANGLQGCEMPYLNTIFGMLHNLASSVLGMTHVRNMPNANEMYAILPDLPVTLQPMSISLLFDKVLHSTEHLDFHAILDQKLLKSGFRSLMS
jgi:hypothetical protein